MYYFTVTVLIIQLFGYLKSEEFCPNVKIGLNGFPNLETVEYSVSPINSEQEMPLPLLDYEITMTLVSSRMLHLYNWWGLKLIKRVFVEKYVWERTFVLPMYVYNKKEPLKNYKFLNNNFTCLNQPMVVEYALVFDEIFPYLMNQYGCNNNRINDNMDKNLIYLVLFNDGILFNQTNINDTLTGYTQMLGILKIINISNEKNTDFENEIVFKKYLEDCLAVSSNHEPIIGANDKIYIDDNDTTLVNPDTSAKFNYLIPLMLVLLLCGILIIKCIHHWIFRANVPN